VAVLGDMLELGSYEEQGHRLVGQRAGHVADVLVTVGPRARWMADEARRVARPPATIREAADQAEAIAFLERTMRPGDNVLVKGSRGMEMERLVAALRRDRED
jgi:UDP-N-acetylmuramoyl-tripeptide--D-alanyl-D-alanine ligase